MDPNVRSRAVDELFGEAATVSRYLEVERELARVQAELGVIPVDAARSICETAMLDLIDLDRHRASSAAVGFPIVGLVEQLAERVPDGHGEYAHWGATTQDIMDTALVLGLRDALAWITATLERVVSVLVVLGQRHLRTPMIGRSQLQHAVPITFGAKVAGWVSALTRHQVRLREQRPRLLRVQLGGAAGTLASLGEVGVTVRARLAEQLGLADAEVGWHTHRDGLAELVTAFGLLTTSLGKIAGDVILLAQTEVGELSEPTGPGRGISSTMPHKRNPVLSQQILVAARLVRVQVAGMLEAMLQDHERGSATWQMEWTLIPDATSYTLAALERAVELLEGIEVHEARMLENLALTDGRVYAEAVMMALAPHMGRQRAHDLVAETVAHAQGAGGFRAGLERSEEIMAVLSTDTLRSIFEGKRHIEMADWSAREFLARLRRPEPPSR